MQFFEKNKLIQLTDIISRFSYLSNIFELDNILDRTAGVEFDVDGDRIKLRSPYSKPIFTHVTGELDYHKKFFFKNSIHKQPLAKALGLKKGKTLPEVWDVTAGMLSDTLLIYSIGFKVRAFERNPIAYILSKNSLALSDIDIELSFLDAKDIKEHCDVIYFDPMYEETNKKALPKKEMRIFREVVGVDQDAKETASCLRNQCQRLVIKRSVKGQPMLDFPSVTFEGKSTAYDVYLKNK